MLDRATSPAVRVFLALPAMPRQIVLGLLEAERDITVVGAASDLAELNDAVATAGGADVVLVSGDGSAVAAAFEHLGVRRVPVVMAIDARGTTVELHEVIPRARALGDVSGAGVVAAIRAVTTDEEARCR